MGVETTLLRCGKRGQSALSVGLVGTGGSRKRLLLTLVLIVWQSSGLGATGNLVVFDDIDENGFDHNAAACGGNSSYNDTSVVHSGTKSVAITKLDSAGAGWQVPSTYSASSDYDGVSLWVNAGSAPTTLTSLAIYDASFTGHFMHLEDAYGDALPANTWIHFQISFSSPLFATALSTPPATVQVLCVVNHSAGNFGQYLFVDDVSLTGADIFKNGFDP